MSYKFDDRWHRPSQSNISDASHTSPHPPLSNEDTFNSEQDLSQEPQIFRCSFCKINEHLSMNCNKIGSKSALQLARNERLCFICLTPGHTAFFCPYGITCGSSICMDKRKPSHGKLLCRAFQNCSQNPQIDLNPPPSPEKPALKRVSRLETSLVCVLDPILGFRHSIRVLLDSGSTRSFITENLAQNLHLKLIDKNEFLISVFGKPAQNKTCSIFQASIFQNFSCTDDFLDFNLISVDKICKPLQSCELNHFQKDYINNKNLSLADPESASTNYLEVDMLIGQDY